jgi:hypothetical protein
VCTVSATACSTASDDGAGSTVSIPLTAVSTTSITATSTTATTPAVTTAPATLNPTEVSTSTVPASTVEVGERASELFVVWGSGVLAMHDADSGRLLRVITTTEFDGQSLYGPISAADGTTYMSQGIEDSWYSCATVFGSVLALTAEGEFTTIGPGGGPDVSANGRLLTYLRSSECRPDPREPDFSFVAIADTVVARDLATGEERSWTFPGAFEDESMSTVVDSVVWYGESLLALVQGRLVRLDPSDLAVPAVISGPAVKLVSGNPRDVTLLATRADGTVVAEVIPVDGGGSPVRLVALDPSSGDEVEEIAVLDQPTFAEVDRSGTRWATVVLGSVTVDGKETTLEVPPQGGDFDPTYKDEPFVVGW